ncbi:MAG TPA: hypothetical protein VK494_00415, partial [Gemmatimonadaceae bacterium]|nr:hypothetical protein [Gemmatimonadaceae bacterium]
EVPAIVALTKTDKVSRTAAREKAAGVSRVLALDSEQVIPFSATTGEGRIELLEAIMDLVAVVPRVDTE